MNDNTPAQPFGVRHLVSKPDSPPVVPAMSYSADLQLNVSAKGNPYHVLAAWMPEAQTETPTPDGQRPGSDSSTDNW